MELEGSALNMAHAEGRKAERFQKAQKWSDAIKCHDAAIQLLSKAEESTTDVRAIESVRLQRDYHHRQIALLEHRQKFDINATLRNGMSKSSECQHNLNLQLSEGEKEESSKRAQVALQTIEDCDSLLHLLNQRTSQEHNVQDKKSSITVSGVKTPKNEAVIIEELRIQNEELRFHILKLLHENQQQASQIAQLTSDNDRLKETASVNNLPNISPSAKIEENLETVEKSSQIESNERGIESEEDENYFNLANVESGELPPLEIPHFDFDAAKS